MSCPRYEYRFCELLYYQPADNLVSNHKLPKKAHVRKISITMFLVKLPTESMTGILSAFLTLIPVMPVNWSHKSHNETVNCFISKQNYLVNDHNKNVANKHWHCYSTFTTLECISQLSQIWWCRSVNRLPVLFSTSGDF